MKNRLPDLNVPARERIGWVDLLRVIACFLVVFSHSCDAFVAVFDSDRATFLQGALAGRFVRACVPLFVLMSGVLLLPYAKMFAPMLGYTGNFGNMGLYGVCDWNEFGTFYYVSGFAGYLVLAYYLVKFPPAWDWRRTLAVCIPMFIAGYLITAFGYVALQNHFPGNYAYLEIVWYFAGINVFMMTYPVFVIVRKLDFKPRAWLSRLAGATFGIYLCHFILVQAGYDLVARIPALPTLLRILLIACLAFAASYLVVAAMQRFRVTRRFVQ